MWPVVPAKTSWFAERLPPVRPEQSALDRGHLDEVTFGDLWEVLAAAGAIPTLPFRAGQGEWAAILAEEAEEGGLPRTA